MDGFWVNEKTGDKYSANSASAFDPGRFFSKDESHQASEYGRMIKERLHRQREQDEAMKKSQQQIEEQMKAIQDMPRPSVVAPVVAGYVAGRVSAPKRGGKRFHLFYFLIIGWWLGLALTMMIVPLFFRGFVKRAFGYWQEDIESILGFWVTPKYLLCFRTLLYFWRFGFPLGGRISESPAGFNDLLSFNKPDGWGSVCYNERFACSGWQARKKFLNNLTAGISYGTIGVSEKNIWLIL